MVPTVVNRFAKSVCILILAPSSISTSLRIGEPLVATFYMNLSVIIFNACHFYSTHDIFSKDNTTVTDKKIFFLKWIINNAVAEMAEQIENSTKTMTKANKILKKYKKKFQR